MKAAACIDVQVLRLGAAQFEPMKPLLTKTRLKRFRRKAVEEKHHHKYKVPHVGSPDKIEHSQEGEKSPQRQLNRVFRALQAF